MCGGRCPMVTGDQILPGAEALADAKSYLRIVGSDEDPLLGQLLAAAVELCEAFTGQALFSRGFVEVIAASSAWTRLGRTPVSAILGVEAVLSGGGAAALSPDRFVVDVDASGDGWVRLLTPIAGRVRVSFRAGLAPDWASAPEPLKQGVIRLVSHLYSHRDDPAGGAPPAAVAALWRPYRRMRLS